jgi:hypothetical protein
MESPKVASLGAGLGQPRLLPSLPSNHPLFLDLDTSNCPWNTDQLVVNILSCHPAASLWRVSSSDLSQNISLTKNDHAPQLSRASVPTCPNPAVASDIHSKLRLPFPRFCIYHADPGGIGQCCPHEGLVLVEIRMASEVLSFV